MLHKRFHMAFFDYKSYKASHFCSIEFNFEKVISRTTHYGLYGLRRMNPNRKKARAEFPPF